MPRNYFSGDKQKLDKIEADDIIVKYCQKYSNIEEIYVYTNDRFTSNFKL